MAARQPNFLIFMTDHQRGDTLDRESPVLTPNIDRLRGSAVLFRHAYCPAPHCCPSRATFFTGLYPSEHGVWNNVNVSNCLSRGLYDNVKPFSGPLLEGGYKLYYAGKWHVSQEHSPADYGFTPVGSDGIRYRPFPHVAEYGEWQAYENGGLDRPDTPREPGAVVRPGYPHYVQYGADEHPFGDDRVVENAVQKLHELSAAPDRAPFMLYVGVLGPHDPYFAPQRFLDLYDPEAIRLPESAGDPMADKPALYRRTAARYAQLSAAEQRESLRHYYAFCSYEDSLFGRLLDALEAGGLAENTMVAYCSDHGDYAGAHGLWAKGLPCFEEAYHASLMIGGAGIPARGREVEDMVTLADFAPTVLELAGCSGGPFTGRSLAPYLRGDPIVPQQAVFSQTNGNEIYGIQRAVWTDRWKYVFNTFDFDELYDRKADPHELHNLLAGIAEPAASPYREVVYALCRLLWQHAERTHDTCVNPYIMTALAPFGPGILRQEDFYGPVEL